MITGMAPTGTIGGARSRRATMPRALCAFGLLTLLAAALMLPAMLASPLSYDSFWIDRTWSEQFTMLLRQGNPYPRWLPLSFGGLGAPVFYFYAPLSFYLAGFFGLIGLPTWPALLATFAAAWIGSGMAMYAWLADKARAPIAGAALYMVLPYHVMDFYARGAVAEFCAFALLPMVALGVEQACSRHRAWPLALSYAALIMTHLPTALLASILLIAPFTAWMARADRGATLSAVRGVAGGLGAAAVYLLPALTLQRHSAIGSLWAVPFLQPAHWSLLHPALWPSRSYVLLFGGMACMTMVATALLAQRRRGFWPLWTMAVAAIVAGLLPGFWSLPLLRAVQFPWRALALAEFGLVTVVAGRRGTPLVPAAVLFPQLMLSALMLSPANPLNGEAMKSLPLPGRQEVIEYLPPQAVAAGRAPNQARLLSVAARAKVAASSFTFPSLRSDCGIPLSHDYKEPMLVRASSSCHVVPRRLPIENAGLALTLLTLAIGIYRVIRRSSSC